MNVNCPTCQKEIEWGEQSPQRPFCSERCKLIDLGEWASGGHAIAGSSEEDELMSEELNRINKDSLH
jgi:endogenous inhibitor of DNA gyrase (YacG/DUF329 family)